VSHQTCDEALEQAWNRIEELEKENEFLKAQLKLNDCRATKVFDSTVDSRFDSTATKEFDSTFVHPADK